MLSLDIWSLIHGIDEIAKRFHLTRSGSSILLFDGQVSRRFLEPFAPVPTVLLSDQTDQIERLRAEVERLRAQIIGLTDRAERAEALADHDVLTPTLNRRGFVAVMHRTMAYCARYGASAVLLYVDLDGFKAVNDALGHPAGDAALVQVAKLLIENVRESDAVGRMGGDEFALLLLNAGPEEGQEKARRLAEALAARPFEWEGRTATLGGSFGVRAWTGQADPEVWLAEADAAMWVRKKGR